MNYPKEIRIDKFTVSPRHPPFIIAELSGNHNQSFERAICIVKAAAKAGVHAVKLQTYTADTMTIDMDKKEFVIQDRKSLWYGKSLFQLYQQAQTPWEWHKPIFEYCRELGVACFSTPFDATAVDFLEKLNVPAYKIASPEIVDLPLISQIASTGKPIIISSGMARLSELEDAVKTARKGGCKDIILLKCTSTYPTDPIDSNILTIQNLIDTFDVQVGLSDHTLGIGAAIASVALGATVIEKHITLNRSDGGVDSAFSMEPDEFALLVKESQQAWKSLGKIQYGPTKSEETSLRFRRSLYIVEDMQKGDVLTQKTLRSIRPGFGLAPKNYMDLLGKRINSDISKGTPMSWEYVD
ncbi:MAG: pseudaminic acid synthase [Pseudomonadota bacterium]